MTFIDFIIVFIIILILVLFGIRKRGILSSFTGGKLDEYLKHDRDLNFAYAGIKQLCDKYLVQNRNTKQIESIHLPKLK